MAKKSAGLSSGLVAVKGGAQAPTDTTGRVQTQHGEQPAVASAPLNFKVDPEFRRRFRQRAAEADLKLNQLLRQALEAWEEREGLK